MLSPAYSYKHRAGFVLWFGLIFFYKVNALIYLKPG